MMETKHTPGPWIPVEQGDADEYCILTPDKKWVAGFRLNGIQTLEKQRANIKLMAAAPELLEALMSIENDNNTIPDKIWKMRNDAIKKATE
jgi:hypothetical protein